MEKDDFKFKYIKLRKKYTELKKEFYKLKSYCEKLKENNEIDLGQIKFLRKENEYLKLKTKNGKPKTPSESNQISAIEEHYSHFLVKSNLNYFPKASSNKVENTGKIVQVAPDQSVYFESSDVYIYQGFFIIGPQTSTIKAKGASSASILYERVPTGNEIGQNIKNLIPDLCFPRGIDIEELSVSSESIENILASQKPPSRSSKEFIITLRNENITKNLSDLPNSEHDLLYIICIEIQDVLQSNNKRWLTPKCYCLATFIPAFELHFKLLESLLLIKNTCRHGNLKSKYESNEEIFALEITQLACYEDCEELQPGKTIQLGIENIGLIRYKCPDELSYIDVDWTCLPLMSSLYFADYFWIICAIIQEKSVVFMSTNLGLVTSCVLGILCLIRPLKWTNLMVPLIPNNLHELLEAPIPILAGTTYVSPITRHELNTIIWVVLDENNFEARVQCSPQLVQEVIEPGNFPYKKHMRNLYGFPENKKIFETTPDLHDKSIEISKMWHKYWSSIIKVFKNNSLLDNDIEFSKAIINTQIFNNISMQDN
jgi:DENN (AEX-3) domain